MDGIGGMTLSEIYQNLEKLAKLNAAKMVSDDGFVNLKQYKWVVATYKNGVYTIYHIRNLGGVHRLNLGQRGKYYLQNRVKTPRKKRMTKL